jgi:hypothetical protein
MICPIRHSYLFNPLPPRTTYTKINFFNDLIANASLYQHGEAAVINERLRMLVNPNLLDNADGLGGNCGT